MKLPLVGQSYEDRSPSVSIQASINCYPQQVQDPNTGELSKVMYGCPGKHLFATLSGDVRGLWSGAGRLFVASAGNFIELNSSGGTISTTAYGPVEDGLPVQIFSNGNQLLLISGGKAYCDNGAGPVVCTTDSFAGVVNVFSTVVVWASGDQFLTDGTWSGSTITINGSTYTIDHVDPSGTLLYLTAPIVGSGANVNYTHVGEDLTAVSGAFLDDTFFVQRPPTVGQASYGRQVNFSAVLDGTTWSGLDFFTKESSPGNLIGLHSDGEQLYLFGEDGFEVWQSNPNASADQNPFQRIDGAGGAWGCASAWSPVSLDGRVYFVGTNDQGQFIAYVLNGFTPVPVSTPAVEAQWALGNFPHGQLVSYAYSEQGTSHWVINFGPSTQTWAYNPQSGAWHERQKWSGSAFEPYLTNLHTFIPEWSVGGTQGVHITACSNVAGGAPPKVYMSSLDFFDDEGTDICWQRVLPYIYSDGKRQFFGRLELLMDTSTLTGPPYPVVTYDFLDPLGAGTFVNPRTMPLAPNTRIWWNRNGSSRQRAIRFTGTGQYKVVLIDANCDVAVGSS